MNRQEFLDRIKSTNIPTPEQYSEIEYVYTWHPCINEVTGKDQIATLWDVGGIRLIRDMMPTAQKAEALEHQIALAKAQVQKIQSAYMDLTIGGEGKIDE